MIHDDKLLHKSFILHPSNDVKYEICLCNCGNAFIVQIYEDSKFINRLLAPSFVCGLIFSPVQKAIHTQYDYYHLDQSDTITLHQITKLIRKIVSMNKDRVEIKVTS